MFYAVPTNVGVWKVRIQGGELGEGAEVAVVDLRCTVANRLQGRYFEEKRMCVL